MLFHTWTFFVFLLVVVPGLFLLRKTRELAGQRVLSMGMTVMLYSVGKDSSVMLHLAMKAFYPSKPPFQLLHVDTMWKFRAMYEFRDRRVTDLGLDLLVYQNPECIERGINPFDHGSAMHTDLWKTEGLKQALDAHGFDEEGYFRTGDLGRFDTAGYLYVVGRNKELIVLPDGKKLFPEPVEKLYLASPLIHELGIFEHAGVLAALVVLDEQTVRERGAIRAAATRPDTRRRQTRRCAAARGAAAAASAHRLRSAAAPAIV